MVKKNLHDSLTSHKKRPKKELKATFLKSRDFATE